jgi:hypothetical protein
MLGVSASISDSASDAEILAWIKTNTNEVLLGGWLFMLGCLCFIWFMGIVRSRLLTHESGPATLTTVVFAGGVAAALAAMLTPAGDIASAISKNDVSASTAAALHSLNDAFFVVTELLCIVFVLGSAILALRTGAFPRLWAFYGILLAIVLVIGPIGWAGLIFGVPIWIIGTAIFLMRPARAAASDGGREPVSATT